MSHAIEKEIEIAHLKKQNEQLKSRIAFFLKCQDEFERTKSKGAAKTYYAVRGELKKIAGVVPDDIKVAEFEFLAR